MAWELYSPPEQIKARWPKFVMLSALSIVLILIFGGFLA